MTTISVTLGIAEPDHTWRRETVTLWLDDTLDEDLLEREAIAAWVGDHPRTDAVHLWLLEDDDDPDRPGVPTD